MAAVSQRCEMRLFLSASDLSEAVIVKLTHPRTQTTFAVARSGDALLEINAWSDGEPHTWLIAGAERVQRDGAFYLATPLDPLFLLLPHLQLLRGGTSEERADGHKGYFRPLGELVSGAADEAALEATALAMPSIARRIRAVCDVKDGYDEPMIRLNDALLLAWLKRKTEAVRAHLVEDASLLKAAAEREAEMHMSQFENTDVQAPDAAERARGDARALAVGLVAEYLGPALQAKLCAAYKVDEQSVLAQRGVPIKKGPPAEVARSYSEASSSAGTHLRDEPEPPPPAKRQAVASKPAASKASSKLGGPLKKGQTTMMGFFAKPK